MEETRDLFKKIRDTKGTFHAKMGLIKDRNGTEKGPSSQSYGWSLPKLMFIESMMPSNYLILWRPLLLPPSIFPSISVFQMSQLFASGGQSIGVSASASVLPTNIQD